MCDKQDNKTKLSDKPWRQLTQEEKTAWREASEKNGPVLFGGALVAPEQFRDTVVRSWNRKVKHTY